jgi:hypothetical protein
MTAAFGCKGRAADGLGTDAGLGIDT